MQKEQEVRPAHRSCCFCCSFGSSVLCGGLHRRRGGQAGSRAGQGVAAAALLCALAGVAALHRARCRLHAPLGEPQGAPSGAGGAPPQRPWRQRRRGQRPASEEPERRRAAVRPRAGGGRAARTHGDAVAAIPAVSGHRGQCRAQDRRLPLARPLRSRGRTQRPLRGAAACFERQQYRSAACYILVIEKLDGAGIGQQHTVRLLDVTLAAGEYDLAGELVRFLVHAGRDGSSCSVPESPIASASKSAANNGPEDGGEVRMGGLAALFARLGVAGQTPQEKEQRDKAAQLARQQRRLQRQQELEERLAREDEELQRRVEEMMREHACALLRRRDLRELVEFTKVAA
eukprot:scaffold2529_cov363-Prasinococcus_capsulatus_cf.AAC.3